MSEPHYFIEDLKPGMTESYTRTVTEADVDLFGAVTGDLNPLHFNEEYAKKTVFGGRIAHGMLTTSYLSTVLGTKMPGTGSIFLSASVRFRAPVRIGDTVTAKVTVRDINMHRRRCVFDCEVRVGETIVVDGEATIMVPSREA
jgi:3-hydroxybutyryl-CoA dehydratase